MRDILEEIRRRLSERRLAGPVLAVLGLLLLVCAERPGAAREVLAQYRHLRRVPPETLLETGLRAPDLLTLGITATRLRQDNLATDAQLSLLGF